LRLQREAHQKARGGHPNTNQLKLIHQPFFSLKYLQARIYHLKLLENLSTRNTRLAIMAMDIDTIPNLLGDQRDQAPDELQHFFIQFEDYWERKLWHELTDSLIEYFSHPESAPQRIPLYETFIKTFAGKINQLKLVTLGLSAAYQCKGPLYYACIA